MMKHPSSFLTSLFLIIYTIIITLTTQRKCVAFQPIFNPKIGKTLHPTINSIKHSQLISEIATSTAIPTTKKVNKMMMSLPSVSSPTISTSTDSNTSRNINNIQTSLASSYVIYIQNDSENSSTIWTLLPIDDAVNNNSLLSTTIKSQDLGVGTKAIEALSSLNNYKNDGEVDTTMKIKEVTQQESSIQLHCKWESDGIIQVNIVDTSRVSNEDDDKDLISILSRVMVQQVISAKDYDNMAKTENEFIKIQLPSISTSTDGQEPDKISEKYLLSDIRSINGCPSLFESFFPPNLAIDGIEMSDMVDQDGTVIGYIPRPLLHKYNVLHRGIGIVVSKGSHITNSYHPSNHDKHGVDQSSADTSFPDVYVHQRTSTKRIFPSLYDMFVGGVSTTGEDSQLTAARELSEELGLKDINAFSSPLFRCVIATSYNRCVVTMFTYQYDNQASKERQERVQWQEEEVQWGDWVSYDVVENAAYLSIQRLKEKGVWPGTGITSSDTFESSNDESSFWISSTNKVNRNNVEAEWKTWDFVPDGLLVWEAWVKWVQRGRNAE